LRVLVHSRRLAGAFALAVTLSHGAVLASENEATWDSIRPEIFGARAIEDGASVLELVAPARAEDAALVPLDLRIRTADGAAPVKAVTLVIDENPAPVAATFTFGEARRAFDLSTRVRVNSYSFVRAVAETSDGRLHMVRAYVKAAGGCSAPATKDPAEASANLGQMRFRTFAGQEAQVQIRHPNYSGLQMDQVTRLYTPAWFIETVTVSQGTRPLFRVEGSIGISEDPTFRFSYRPSGEPVTVEAKDTNGQVFRQQFPGGQAF
jgi:sulfur-oxidizing protein SoxY